MNFKQLSYFSTVAQTGSFSRAAEMLNVSQSTLSMSMKKLEDEIGIPLFYSFNRRQCLTDSGVRLQESANKILNIYQTTIEDIQNNSGEAVSGKFRLGLSPLFGDCFFGDLIPEFSTKFPNIQIDIIEDGAYKMYDLLENGDVDLALMLLTERTNTLKYCHFSTQRNVVLLNEKHPLAHSAFLTVADLRNESFAIFNHNFILHHQILSACHEAGFHPKFALLSSQWDFMMEIVSKNRAISILPKPVLDKHPAPHVVGVPLVDSMKYWDIVLAWNQRKQMPGACTTFLNYIQKNLPGDTL